MKLVLIEWIDSHSGRGWRPFDELEEHCEPLRCRSVGFVLKETASAVMLVPHVYAEGQGIVRHGCGDLAIPKKAIVKTTILKHKSQSVTK